MRHLIASVFCFLLFSTQAYACRDPRSWNTIFFESPPNVQLNADLVARISLSDVNESMETATVTATATVINVLKASNDKIQPSQKTAIKYAFTSCGPDHKSGDKGMIIARIGTDDKGRLVLYPYMHNDRDRIESPAL